MEWELQCVLDEMAEETDSVANGNGHILSTRTVHEQNGTTPDEISHSNGYHAPQSSTSNYKELLMRSHIQQRLNTYKELKQIRIEKFLAHLDSKQMQYLENICPN